VTISNNFNKCDINQCHNGEGDNVQVKESPITKTIFDYFSSWYGILGTTATIGFGMLGWYALRVQLGWWFFGF